MADLAVPLQTGKDREDAAQAVGSSVTAQMEEVISDVGDTADGVKLADTYKAGQEVTNIKIQAAAQQGAIGGVGKSTQDQASDLKNKASQ